MMGLTLKEMAQRIGVSQAAVQYWKNGKNISLETLSRLAVALNVSLDYLTGASNDPNCSGNKSRQNLLTNASEEPSDSTNGTGLEKRLEHLEQACTGMNKQLDEIRRLLISLLAAEHREADAPRESESEKGVKAG